MRSITGRVLAVLLMGSIAATWSGCGDSEVTDSGGGLSSGGSGGADAGDEGSVISLAGSAGDGTNGAAGTAGTGTGPGGDCLSCAAGQICVDGACACPLYQSFCDGSCMPSSIDPANCGDCGATCDTDMVCSGGGCASSCLPGLTPCAGACHDILTSNEHCNGCDMPCAEGEGCADGNCVPTLELGPAPDKCAGGGPPITIDTGIAERCAGDLAQTTFPWAICSCTDVTSSTTLFVDGFDSSKGPYAPGELGGGVGVNGSFKATHDTDIWGTLWASGDVTTSSPAQVHNDLRSGGTVNVKTFEVGDDAYVSGDSTGTLAIAGTLTTPDTAVLGNNVTYGDLTLQPVSVPEPCRCEPDAIIPVADIVAAHAADNDDELIGLDPEALNMADRPARVDLPCGEYYFAGIAGGGPLTIVAHGRTAIYIEGDVVNSTFLAFTLEPGAELDIFISGTLTTSNDLIIGSPNYPALTRMYVGTSDVVRFSANARLAGNFYAANAQVIWTSTSEAYGAIFAGEFTASATTMIHYDRAVSTIGDQSCGEPPGAGGASGNPEPPTCGSCTDCNNQACIDGACGQCTSNSDCCSPLECSDGVCLQVVK